jgi:hypothetical protein
VRFSRPVAYQEIQGRRREVPAAYFTAGNRYGFEVGTYDESRPLIIDPLLASTYIGSSQLDNAYDVLINAAGEIYVTGTTYTNDFPTTAGAFDTTWNYSGDAFVSKFDSGLSNLLASTFLGGYGEDAGYSLATDASGNILVAGWTFSPDFPVTPGCYGPANRGLDDIFVAKLSGDLSSLLASTMLGGLSNDVGYRVIVDPDGLVVVTGYSNSSNFPTTTGAFCQAFNGNNDVVVSRLDGNLSNLVTSTFLGGNGSELGYSIIRDPAGGYYVSGSSVSTNFPTTAGAYCRELRQAPFSDVFIARLDSNLATLAAATLIGGRHSDDGYGLALDGSGNVYVAGRSYSTNYPTTPGAYQTVRRGGQNGIISKLDGNLTTLLTSTYIGGTNNDLLRSIVLDSSGNVLVAGHATSSNYPTTPGAYDETWNGDYDVVVSKLDANLATLIASTFIGGVGEDSAQRLTLDRLGRVCLAGYTMSTNYPTTGGAYSSSLRGVYDVIISKLDSTLSASFLPPAGVTATKGTSTNKVQVAWSPVSGATRYAVYRHSTNNPCAASNLDSNVTGTTFDDTTAQSGLTYYYWVQAHKTAGASDVSLPDTGYRAFPPPANLVAGDGEDYDCVALTWDAEANAAGYSVWRGLTEDPSAAELLAGGLTPAAYNDRAALPGQLYYYYVSVSNALSASALSPAEAGWRKSRAVTQFADLDFDGDRKMDLLIYQPATGLWTVKLSGAGYNSASLTLGDAAATAIPADFDGDLKADPASYAAAAGLWTIKLSAAGYADALLAGFGSAGLAPVQADYDGDGKADPALYQEESGSWQFRLSGSGYLAVTATLGGPGAVAMPADYDGDRLADPAVYGEAAGLWQVMLSAAGYGVATLAGFGGAGQEAAARDYDGDRRADPALYQRSTGLWLVKLSGSGYATATASCGGPWYTAMSGDYDGDGKADLMVYQNADGGWMVMLSASGYAIGSLAGFGGPGWLP